jgi:hypothetical protein
MADAQLQEIPLGGGLDETNEDAFVPFDRMRICQNVVFPDANSAVRRPGLQDVGNPLANGRKLIAHGSEILVVDGVDAWSWSASQNAYLNRGPVSQCSAKRRLLGSGNNSYYSNVTGHYLPYSIPPLGSIINDPNTGLQVAAWCDGVSYYCSIYDPVNEMYVVPPTAFASPAGGAVVQQGETYNPRCIIVSHYLYIAHREGGGLYLAVLDMTNISAGFIGSPLSLSGPDPTICWDACISYSASAPATVIAIVCIDEPTGHGLFYSVAVSGSSAPVLNVLTAITPASAGAGAEPLGRITCAPMLVTDAVNYANVAMLMSVQTTNSVPNTTKIYFASINNFTASTPAVFHASNITFTGGDTVRCLSIARDGLGATSATTYILLMSADYYYGAGNTAATSLWIGRVSIDTTTYTLSFASIPVIGYQTISKPILHSVNGAANVYALLVNMTGKRGALLDATNTATPTIAQTLCLSQIPIPIVTGSNVTPLVQAVCAPRFAGAVLPANQEIVLLNGGNGITALGTEEDEANGISISAIDFNFSDPNLWQSVTLGPWSYIAGGVPMIYDGAQLCEIGFLNTPLQLDLVLNAGSGLPAIKTLTYQVVFTQQDSNGNIHRSPPSAARIADASSGYGSATLTVVGPQLTYRSGIAIQIEIYRNNSGSAGGAPTIMQFLGSGPYSGLGTVTFTDATIDGGNASSEILYTTGGGVPSDCPSNLSALATHANRVFGVSEDGQTSYFSVGFVRGEAPRFTDAFTQTWPEGPLTAMWSLEQRLHAATTDDIWYMFGEGPNDSGAGSDFTTPSLWQASLGVTDARGVAIFPGGVLLSTSKGIYLEGRDGSFTWMSMVRRTLAAWPIVTGMTALDADGAIRVNLQNVDGINQQGLTLHYDYRHQKWSQHLVGSVTTAGVLSSCVAGGTYYALATAQVFGANYGVLLQEVAASPDGTPGAPTWITVNLQTGWQHASGMQGFQRLHRVMVLGKQVTPAQLTLSVFTDYGASAEANTATFTDAAMAGLSIVQCELTASPQKCESFSLGITDAAPASPPYAQGIEFTSAIVRFRGKRGEYRQTPGNLRQ